MSRLRFWSPPVLAVNQLGSRRYVATSLAATLTRGEYRILPDDRIRACCLDCGQLVDGATIDPFPQHGCIPTPDPDLVA